MVIDGITIKRSHVARAKVEGERIRLPENIIARVTYSQFNGKTEIEAWLLVVSPGRYRLIVGEKAEVSRILDLIAENEATGGVLDRTEDDEQAGIAAKLIPCVISPPPPGWRVNFPQVARDLMYEKEERSFVFFLIVAGYIEIWFPDKFRHIASRPISKFLSD
jgi:hypothetical protein